MSNAAVVNEYDVVTARLELRAPVASSLELTVSLSAQWVAVPFTVTVPPDVIAATVTLRPLGDRAAGEPIVGAVRLPSVLVDVAAA